MQHQGLKNELDVFSVKNIMALQICSVNIMKIIYVHLYLEYFGTENAAPTAHV